jgi:hypothetical protein
MATEDLERRSLGTQRKPFAYEISNVGTRRRHGDEDVGGVIVLEQQALGSRPQRTSGVVSDAPARLFNIEALEEGVRDREGRLRRYVPEVRCVGHITFPAP